jgi:phosphotransferase system enzyme I (PtsI)
VLTKKGIPVSPGVCIGKVLLLGQESFEIPRRTISASRVKAEVARLDRALMETADEIDGEIASLGADLGVPQHVLESHRDIVTDPALRREIAHEIESKLNTAEQALVSVLRGYYRKFAAMESEYISERAHDLADIERKILRILLGRKRGHAARPGRDTVIVGHSLTPSQAASMHRASIKGFAIDVGGRTSHTAIVARAMQMPAVLGLEDISRQVAGGEEIIIDGYTGVVIIEPDEPTLERYRRKASISRDFYRQLRDDVRLPAETLDGYEVGIAANIEFPDEIQTALEWGARGIGLYRTEFLYDGRQPDEEKHFTSYRRAIEELGGRYLVVRTLDAGADKFHNEAVGYQEPNPFLGCRSIRLCFQRPELFRAQIRAILRAAALGPLRLMLPMVSNLDELRRAREIIQDVEREMVTEGFRPAGRIPLGIMVEVPSAALLADRLAREVDFFSIGTNDLVQYSLAVDRMNERVAHLYQPTHPAILRLISTVIEAGRREAIDVSICGEMCGEPIYTVLLLGLGLRSFSVSPIAIPTVKRVIRRICMRDAVEVARACLAYESSQESEAFLEARIRDMLPEVQEESQEPLSK